MRIRTTSGNVCRLLALTFVAVGGIQSANSQDLPFGYMTPAAETVPGDIRTISVPTPFGLATSLTAHDDPDGPAYFVLRGFQVEGYDFPDGTTPPNLSGYLIVLSYNNGYPDGYEGPRESRRTVATAFAPYYPAYRAAPPTVDYRAPGDLIVRGGTVPADQLVTMRVRIRDAQPFAHTPITGELPGLYGFVGPTGSLAQGNGAFFTDRDGNEIVYSRTDDGSAVIIPDAARPDDLYPTVDALASMILATAPGSEERATAQARYDALTGASEILASQGRIVFDNAELTNMMVELAELTAHMMALPVTATTSERTDLQNRIDAATARQTEIQARIDADTARVLAFRSRPTDALVTDRDSALQTIGLSIARAEFEAYSSTEEVDQAIAARRADAFRREWAVIAAAEPTPTAGKTEQTFVSRLSRALRRGDDYQEYDGDLDPVEEIEVGSDHVVDGDVVHLTEVLLTGLNNLHARIGTQTTAIATQTASIAQLNTTTTANAAAIATNTTNIASNVARLSVVEQGIEEAKDGVALALALAAKPALYGKNFLLTFGTGYYDGAGAAAVSLSGNVGTKFAWGVGYSGAGSQTGAQASFKIRF